MTVLAALYRMGYKGVMTGHGYRGVASTILHEHGFNTVYINAQLAHKDKDQVSSAYNHAQYLQQRKEILEWWAVYVSELATVSENDS
jgi:integrase